MNIKKEGQNEVKMVQYIHGFGGYDVQHCGLIRQLPHARRNLHVVGCLTWPLSWKTSCFQSICVQIASCHVLMFFFSSRISNFWTSHLRSNLHQLYQTVWLSFGWAASPPCWCLTSNVSNLVDGEIKCLSRWKQSKHNFGRPQCPL